jgi:3-oxoacyl-[acyl-carrier protein] reductase
MVALITGGAQGIGRAIALHLAASGCKVILADVNVEKLNLTAAEFKKTGHTVEIFAGDLAEDANRQSLVAQFPHINILINNAGITNAFTSIEHTSAVDFERIMNVNFRLPYFLTQAYLPKLKTLNKSWVINIASSANIEGYPGQSVYAASKAALSSFTDTLAKECADISGFKAVTILPSRTDTAMNENLRGNADNDAQSPDVIGQVIADIIAGKLVVNSGDDIRIKHEQVLVEQRIGEREF